MTAGTDLVAARGSLDTAAGSESALGVPPARAQAQMKLAFYINSLAQGGAERIALLLAESFGAAERPSIVITDTAPERDFYTHDARVVRIGLETQTRKAPVTAAGHPSSMWQKVALRPLRSILRSARTLRRLRRHLRAQKPDVLVTMLPHPNILGIVAARSAGVPVIACERNYPPARPLSPFWAVARWLVYRKATGHVAQTQGIADWLTRRVAARNVTIIPNPLRFPLGRHEPVIAPETVLPADRRVILAVGSKCWQKGFDRLPAIFAPLARAHPDWDLVILGMHAIFPEDRTAEARLHREIAAQGLGGRIHIVPKAGNVGDWYARAEIFALTSRFEGFPNVLLEAMAHELPAIAFDCPTGPGDILRHGQNGLLIADGDCDAFGAALSDLVGDAEGRARLGAQARDVRQEYEEAAILQKWRAALEQVRPAPALQPAARQT